MNMSHASVFIHRVLGTMSNTVQNMSSLAITLFVCCLPLCLSRLTYIIMLAWLHLTCVTASITLGVSLVCMSLLCGSHILTDASQLSVVPSMLPMQFSVYSTDQPHKTGSWCNTLRIMHQSGFQCLCFHPK